MLFTLNKSIATLEASTTKGSNSQCTPFPSTNNQQAINNVYKTQCTPFARPELIIEVGTPEAVLSALGRRLVAIGWRKADNIITTYYINYL